MESAVEANKEARSEIVGEKRPAAEEDVDLLKEESPLKRIKGGSERCLARDVKKVAEMVLVLAAMGKMRGGKGPTDSERDLMAEARNRLAKVCEGFAPKDVFPRDAFGGVLEDLGLNKLKEQRLGFRPPKMTIAEKLLVSKRKMEKAADFSLPSTPHSSRLPGYSSTAVENRGASHPVRMSQSDKPSHMLISPGNFQSTLPLVHSNVSNSTSLPYQLPTSEIRPIGSSALPTSHLSSAASQRVDRPNLRSDGRSNGSPHPTSVQANYPVNSTARTPTWSLHHQPTLSSKIGPDNKLPVNMSLKVEGVGGVKSGLAPQAMSRGVVTQTIGGPSSQGTNHVHPPAMGNTHAEIGKIVQKLLQPRSYERPTWNPPSRDYMNKVLTCQMCMSTVTDIDSILICDACEKGYHLKCLQATNQKGIPRGEWHCGKCLSLSNGKPLPPKYGRVMRNMNTSKVPSNSAAVPSTSSNKVSALDEKVSQPKLVVNGSTTTENTPAGVADSNHSHQTSGSERTESKEMQENENGSISRIDDKGSSESGLNDLINISNSAGVSSMNSLVEKMSDEHMTELKPNPSAKLVMIPNSSDESQTVANAEGSAAKQSLGNHFIVRDSEESQGNESSNDENQLKEREVVCNNPSGNASTAGAMGQPMSSSDGLPSVNWVGDPIQVLDKQIYYSSCRINGTLYKATDHVLIRLEHGKLIPSKLLAMWEDKNTAQKLATVNMCYFPSDLPESVGRPCGLESSEVYESTCGRTIMAGSIQGPCEVLPPRRFAEEIERRSCSGKPPNDQFTPLYVCKWIYDEAKGLFRDISF